MKLDNMQMTNQLNKHAILQSNGAFELFVNGFNNKQTKINRSNFEHLLATFTNNNPNLTTEVVADIIKQEEPRFKEMIIDNFDSLFINAPDTLKDELINAKIDVHAFANKIIINIKEVQLFDKNGVLVSNNSLQIELFKFSDTQIFNEELVLDIIKELVPNWNEKSTEQIIRSLKDNLIKFKNLLLKDISRIFVNINKDLEKSLKSKVENVRLDITSNDEIVIGTQKKNSNKQFKMIWKHFGHYLKEEKWSIIGVFMLAIVSSTIAIGGNVCIQYAMQYLPSPGGTANFARVSTICGIIIGIFCADWVILYFQYILTVKMGQRIAKRIRDDLYKKINNLPIRFFDQNKAGNIISNFTNDVNAISSLLSDNLTDIIGTIVYFVGVTIGMFFISVTLTFVTLALAAIILLSTSFFLKKSQPYFAQVQSTIADITGFLDEYIPAQALIDTYNQQELVFEKFKGINKKTAKAVYYSQVYGSASIPVTLSLTNISTAIITICAASMILTGHHDAFVGIKISFVYDEPTIVSPEQLEQLQVMNSSLRLTVFLILARNLMSPLVQLSNVFTVIMSAKAGTLRIIPVFEQKEEYTEFEKIVISIAYDKYKHEFEFTEDETHKVVEPKIEFKNVTFGYNPERPVLKDISFTINKGDFIGIVGPTGSGKTTIVNLITKLYEVDKGDILIDDTPISQVTKASLRNNISMVLQETFFFDKTVKENLKIANENATDEQIIEACKLANCHDLIMRLKDGYDTVLSNNADIFSKGEKQLLAIARAILYNVHILILDEATSSVDTKTEKQIQHAMNNLIKDKTSIMIAHRLSTIRDATKILVIKDGELIESGNHDELIELDGFYAKLYNSQLNVIE